MRRQNGFTIIELMVTLVVLAVLIGIAVPSFSGMIRDNRNLALRNELTGALQLARSEAVKRRTDVVICRSNADNDACTNGTDWSGGWLMRVQLNTTPPSNAIARVWEGSNSVVITGPAASITFKPNGMANASTFNVKSSSCSSPNQHVVKLSATGSLSTKQETCQ